MFHKILITACICTLLLPALSGCQTEKRYHRYQATGPDWKPQDTLSFKLPQTLSCGQYIIGIEVRHSDTYSFRDLWIALHHPLLPSRPADTLHLYLANPDGRWKGNGRTLIQFASPYSPFTLLEGDSLLQIVHLMQQNPLKGISDIGICLLPATGGINTQKNK